MVSKQSASVMQRAKQFYQEKLQQSLEADHLHRFVAIEPDSGEFFLGDSLSEATAGSRAKYPDRQVFVLRIGHAATVTIGGLE